MRDTLIRQLTDGDSAAAGRIVLALDGKGFALRVAGPRGPRVMGLHGNEVDDWNVVDYEAVRQKARDILRGQNVDADWRPNAGSRMVVVVMNDIKQEFCMATPAARL